jgi:hypothetical protein
MTGRPSFIHGRGGVVFATIKHVGWQLEYADGRVETFATKELAWAAANAARSHPCGAAVAGEREHDAKQVEKIRRHQRAEARRVHKSHSQSRQRDRMSGGKTLSPAGNTPEGTGSRVTTGQHGDRQPQ